MRDGPATTSRHSLTQPDHQPPLRLPAMRSRGHRVHRARTARRGAHNAGSRTRDPCLRSDARRVGAATICVRAFGRESRLVH